MKDARSTSILSRVKMLVIGGAREVFDPAVFHNITLIAFFAWVGLGADGLSSSCYGPEEAYLALGAHTHLAVFVAVMSGVTVFVLSASYSQIIELFPTGGGGYLVASKLLSPKAGMVSGCALMIDYVLTIAISVASGADAVFSFLPHGWLEFKLPFAVAGVFALTVLNMRGVKESVIPLVPIFLIFIITHAFFIVYALATHMADFSGVAAGTAADIKSTYSEVGMVGMLFLILRAYSMGAGTYTGIEAVSNGLPIIREPRVRNGKRTMRYMSVSLAFTVTGLILAYLFFHVEHVPGKTLNAVLFESMTQGWGGWGYALVLSTLFSEAVLLFVAAQTGFLGGPRVLANMALDRWFPTKFALLSNRLVSQKGILLMGGAALATVALTRGSVRFLVVLYSINVFITFFLSQLGLVVHWRREDRSAPERLHKLAVAGMGLFITGFILVTMTAIKFFEGGWITLLVTSVLIGMALYTKKHYLNTARMLLRLDGLVEAAGCRLKDRSEVFPECPPDRAHPTGLDRKARTAVLLVNGYNGLGLHTLLNIIRLFGGTFRNFVFLQVGVVDAGTFRGVEELERLKARVDSNLAHYVNFVNGQGFYGKGYSSYGIDVVEEVAKVAPVIMDKYPDAVFFGGQLVFPDPSIFTGMLHNYTIFAVQRHFYTQGIPIVMMPIRI